MIIKIFIAASLFFKKIKGEKMFFLTVR